MENQKEKDIVKRIRARIPPQTKREARLTIDIVKRIREVLEHRGETVSELAVRMNMETATVRTLLTGLQPLSIKDIVKFEAALDTKLLQVTTDSAPIV